MIPYGRQSISEEDIAAVVDVLRSDFLTQGPAVTRFEQALAEYAGAAHAIAVSNGTAALHLACLAAGLGEGGLLWTTPNSFAASANCGRYCGADVDFVDIDSATFNMSAERLAEKLERAERKPDVVIPVHHSGLPCDLEAMRDLADRYGFTLIEDACHALGATYRDERTGACTYSRMAVFSFHPVKGITTGEGGAILTNDDALADHMRLLRTHGITRDPKLLRRSGPPWYYEQVELGYNFRITDIQCALGASQLKRLDRFVDRRNELAARYDELLADLPVVGQTTPADRRSARHLYVVRIPDGRRDEVGERMLSADIRVNLHYVPIHLHPYYRDLGFHEGDFPEAERYGADALTLPLFPDMTEEQQDEVVRTLAAALGD